jgi:enoyl-CoA hydratase/carnithine racemase
MAVVETERHGQVLVVRMNRPERLNALDHELRSQLAATWTEFRHNNELEAHRSRSRVLRRRGHEGIAHRWRPRRTASRGGGPVHRRRPGKARHRGGYGFAMGGGFMLVERTDLRVASRGVVFEVSEAKRWLLGGYNHGHIANLPYPVAMEMALDFRFTSERFYEIGFLNRLVEPDALMPTAFEMAPHLLTLPPASRVNTVHMMRQMLPSVGSELGRLATALHDHGAKRDLMESRAAFAEKRSPPFKGWDDPEDRYRLPKLDLRTQ